MAQEIKNPYGWYAGLDGLALELGKIYIGLENEDPETSPKAVYWDSGLTIPATQPIRTLAGYPDRDGSPGRLYVTGPYSIRVRTVANVQVFYTQSAGESENEGAGQPYLVHFFHEETMGVSQTIGAHVFDRDVTLAADMPSAAYFYVGTDPASEAILTLQKSGTGQFGTLTVNTNGDVTVASDETSFAAGDALLIIAPDSATTLADFAGTFTGETD